MSLLCGSLSLSQRIQRLAVVGLSLGLMTVAAEAQITFGPVQNFAVGTRPFSAAKGDLEGDGDLDVVVANYDSATITVLRNNGNGTFATAQNVNVGTGPISLALGDLDNDGDLDVVAVNAFDDTASILKNNGNGTFGTLQSFVTGDVSFPYGVTVGDIDRDGDLDLAVVNNVTGVVTILKNNGNATFTAPVNFPVGNYPYAVVLGDLDNDTDLDLAVVNGNSNTVSILKNNGTGTFAAAQNFNVGVNPYALTLGDLDEDGDLDLAVANRGIFPTVSNTISVLRNNGTGTFAAATNFIVGNAPSSVTTGDLDKDGDLDLAVANRDSDSISVLLNNGNATFTAAQSSTVGTAPVPVLVGDLDNDGDLEAIVANSLSDNLSVLFNTTAIVFATRFGSNTNWTNNPFYGQRINFFADVTGDGRADAVAVNDGSITVRRSNGSFFTVPTGTDGEVWSTAFFGGIDTFLSDVTGDGRADIIAVNTTGTTIRRSNGSRFGINETWSLAFYNTDTGTGRGTFFGDVDGDGKSDVVVVSNAGVFIKRSTGSIFGTTQAWSAVPFYGNVGTFLADVTGDGKADLIAVNTTGTTVRRSTGQVFGPPQFWGFPFYNTDTGLGRGTFFADVTGDGKADAIVVNNGGISVQRSTGTAFGPTVFWGNAFYGTRGTFFAEVNGDLRADVLVVNDTNITVRRAQ